MEEQGKIPETATQSPWFFILTHGRYLAVVYNKKGKPVWSPNAGKGRFESMLEHLLEKEVFSYYQVPKTPDLNSLFSSGKFKGAKLGMMQAAEGGLGAFPSFSSKNVLESEDLAPHFITTLPLSNLHLIPLDRDYFAGVISFPEIADHILATDSKLTILCDDESKIIGYNVHFANILNLKTPDRFLNKPLSSLLKFNRPLFPQTQDPFESKKPVTAGKWDYTSGHFPFEPTLPGQTQFLKRENSIRWDNSEGRSTQYARWSGKIPCDNHHVDLELQFCSPDGDFPQWVMRGVDFGANRSPDIFGYSLSQSSRHVLYFKKNTEPVSFQPPPPLTPGKTYRLTVQKRFDHFRVALNGSMLFQWQDGFPTLYKTQDLFYLFLKGGQRVDLVSFKFRSTPYTRNEFEKAIPPLRARFEKDDQSPEYNVSFFQRTLSAGLNQNIVRYHLEDISDLRDSIIHLQQERDALANRVHQEQTFVGVSPSIQGIRSDLDRVAQSNLSLLIEGETGTGKEVLARTLHRQSPRAKKPFIKIDCMTIPKNLFESELFGYEAGAFTGAGESRPGRFELAKGGTIFLDEIGNIPLETQGKLLNVLQDRQVQRLGGTDTIPLDFRLVAATNASLQTLMAAGQFREDFFYRLNQFHFNLPPLRARTEDIPLLAEHFLKEANTAYFKKFSGFSKPALKKLVQAPFPGNVRELRNAVMRAVVMSTGEVIKSEAIALQAAKKNTGGNGKGVGGFREKSRITRQRLISALRKNRGNVRRTAKNLGLSRNFIYLLAERLSVDLQVVRKGR